MKTYTLKSVIRRGSMFAAAFAIVIAAVAPAASTYADALNPLTDRSLTLSSSAPGWDFKDGSGNTTYADPNSGANGQKTGNTFSFKVSTNGTNAGTNPTNTAIQAFTFQYCTRPAGTCTSPGNNGTTTGVRNADSVANQTSDLRIAAGSAAEVDNAVTPVINASGATVAVPSKETADGEGNYIVMVKVPSGTWEQSKDWVMTASNDEDGQTVSGNASALPGVAPTGQNNFVTLTNITGIKIPATSEVKIVFFGTNDNYITNPGKGAFFVKINTYKSTSAFTETNLIDGGVTVANVMNLGISIQTKVLETMDFSVGTVDPYTLDSDGGAADSQLDVASEGTRLTHGTCDPVLNSMDPANDAANTLLLGSAADENSLNTDHTYSTHSYFRLSSNASAGATVYYSGVTLSNTVGDKIKPIGANKVIASRGSEQFGLALANDSGTSTADPDYKINYKTERAADALYESGADNDAAGLVALNNVAEAGDAGTGTGVHSSVASDWTTANIVGKAPQLTVRTTPSQVVLAPETNYNEGGGVVNTGVGYTGNAAKFAFDDTSNLIPVPIASENTAVVDCASAKVRYIANIAATTPAGIYTTKINFIASPQY